MPLNDTKAARLIAAQPVELEPGVIMPAGIYDGTSTRIGLQTTTGTSWTSPQYRIEFSAEQLWAMGAKVGDGIVSEEWDVSKHVGGGELAVG